MIHQLLTFTGVGLTFPGMCLRFLWLLIKPIDNIFLILKFCLHYFNGECSPEVMLKNK